MWKGVAVAGAAIVVIVLAVVAADAGGIPSAPSATITAQPNPTTTQTVQVTLETQTYSLVAPNSVSQLGAKFVYTAKATSASGAYTTLAQNAAVSATPASVSGSLYTLTATISVTLPSLCSGTGCASMVYNLTFDVYATVATLAAFWQGPTSHIVFSNVASYQSVPKLVAPNPASYDLQLYGSATGIGITVLGAILLLGVRSHVPAILEGALVVVLIGELVFWLPAV